jgi:hypothetical protein
MKFSLVNSVPPEEFWDNIAIVRRAVSFEIIPSFGTTESIYWLRPSISQELTSSWNERKFDVSCATGLR